MSSTESPPKSPQEQPVKRQSDPDIVTDIPFMHTAKRLKVEARKIEGMQQRELYSLIGDNTPPVALATNINKFKNRPEWQQKAVSWELADFEPKPGLKLQHWVRSTLLADGSSTYLFSKYNTPLKIPHWEDSEYASFSSKEWSLEETRYLFDLAEEYDLRWIVIADRYKFEKPRSIEDLKERYYEVCCNLIKNSPTVAELGLSPQDEQQIAAMQFPKQNEIERKKHLEQLMARSPKDVAEEEALILEARRLESMSSQMLAERKELIKSLETPSNIVNKNFKVDISTSNGVSQLITELQSEKATKPPAITHTESVSPIISKLAQGKFTDRERHAYGIKYLDPNQPKHPGVYLRSTKLAPIKQSLLPKYRTILSELKLPFKPVMSTNKVCTMYDIVYQDISNLLEAKKVQDKLEMEIEVLKKAKSS